MKWLKRILKILAWTLSLVVLLLVFFVVRFFIVNDAPITKGEVDRKIEYKEGLSLDIYSPTKQVFSKSPVVIYFHGGAWVMGNKLMVNLNRFNSAINMLREKGYTIVTPAYTLANDSITPFPMAIDDVRDALCWVKENGGIYNLDIHNIGILAESAGAQLAMMAIYANECEQMQQSDSLPYITYFIDAYAPVELNLLYDAGALDSMKQAIQKFPAFMQKKMNFAHYLFDFDPARDTLRTQAYLTKYSPIYYINNQIPSILIIQGKADKVVPIEQSLLLKQRLDSLHIKNEILLLEGVSHVLRGATKKQHELVQKTVVDFAVKNYRF